MSRNHFAAVIALVFVASSPAVAEKLKSHADGKNGFQVSYPANWTKSTDPGMAVVFASPDGTSRWQLVIVDVDAKALEVLEATEQGLGSKNLYEGKDRILDAKQVKSANAEEAVQGMYGLETDGSEQHLLMRVFKKGEKAFIVQEMALEDENLPDRMEAFKQITNTFKITGSGAKVAEEVAADEPAVAEVPAAGDDFDKEFNKRMEAAQAEAAGGAVDMDNMGKIGLYVTLGFFGLLALLVIPLALRFSRKGIKRGKAFNQGPLHLGFTNDQGTFSGQVQGHPASIKPGFGADLTSIGTESGMDAYKSAMSDAGEGDEFESPKFFHSFELKLKVPGASFPPTAIFDSSWWKRFGESEAERRELPGEKLAVSNKGVEVFGNDAGFAERVLSNPEFQLHAAKWPFLNLELNGDEVTLTLLNKWTEMESKFGESLWNWKFADQGYALMLAAAKTR